MTYLVWGNLFIKDHPYLNGGINVGDTGSGSFILPRDLLDIKALKANTEKDIMYFYEDTTCFELKVLDVKCLVRRQATEMVGVSTPVYVRSGKEETTGWSLFVRLLNKRPVTNEDRTRVVEAILKKE